MPFRADVAFSGPFDQQRCGKWQITLLDALAQKPPQNRAKRIGVRVFDQRITVLQCALLLRIERIVITGPPLIGLMIHRHRGVAVFLEHLCIDHASTQLRGRRGEIRLVIIGEIGEQCRVIRLLRIGRIRFGALRLHGDAQRHDGRGRRRATQATVSFSSVSPYTDAPPS